MWNSFSGFTRTTEFDACFSFFQWCQWKSCMKWEKTINYHQWPQVAFSRKEKWLIQRTEKKSQIKIKTMKIVLSRVLTFPPPNFTMKKKIHKREWIKVQIRLQKTLAKVSVRERVLKTKLKKLLLVRKLWIPFFFL